MKDKDLVYIAQGYLTDIYINKNDLEVVTLARAVKLGDKEVEGEVKKEVLRILRKFKRIPKNFNTLPIITEDEFNRIYDGNKIYLNKVLRDYCIKNNIDYGGKEEILPYIVPKYIAKNHPEKYGTYIGSGLPQKVMRDLDIAKRVQNERSKLVFLKKLNRKYLRGINKNGLNWYMKVQ